MVVASIDQAPSYIICDTTVILVYHVSHETWMTVNGRFQLQQAKRGFQSTHWKDISIAPTNLFAYTIGPNNISQGWIIGEDHKQYMKDKPMKWGIKVVDAMYGRAIVVLNELRYMCKDIIPVDSTLKIYGPLTRVEYELMLIMLASSLSSEGGTLRRKTIRASVPLSNPPSRLGTPPPRTSVGSTSRGTRSREGLPSMSRTKWKYLMLWVRVH